MIITFLINDARHATIKEDFMLFTVGIFPSVCSFTEATRQFARQTDLNIIHGSRYVKKLQVAVSDLTVTYVFQIRRTDKRHATKNVVEIFNEVKLLTNYREHFAIKFVFQEERTCKRH
jgi:hypothetical protein